MITIKKCIFSWFGYIDPLGERLKMIKESGFDSTCLWWEDETYPKLIKVDEMPTIVRKNGLFIDNIHCPYIGINNIWSINTKERNIEIKKYKGYIDACKMHNIDRMVMHVTDEGVQITDKSIGIESIIEINKYARNNNIKVAIENTRDVDIINLLLETIPSNNLGLCYDSSHDWLMGQSKGAILEKWQERLFVTHLSDNDMSGDLHWIPMDGKVDWNYIMPIVKQTKIENVTLELMSSKNKINEPREFLKDALKSLEKLMGEGI